MALLAFAAVAPCAARSAELNPGHSLSELTQGAQEEETTTTTSTTSTSSNPPTNSHSTVLLATGAAVLLLSGIGFVIARDARRVAPAGDPELVEGSTARHSEAALRKRRAKAKAARQQRKRNR